MVPAALNVVLLKPTQKAACLGRLAHEAGVHSRAGGEEEEGQDPLPGGKAAHKATKTGPKECEGELTDTQRSSRPMDSWSEPH